ncbi:MAG: tRNA (adenosine(37)-N6)-dimethylallyltransferase MiaA [Clostridiales bacterium]
MTNKALKKVIAVVGPTASGKSGLAVNLAKALDGEIISGDSMQIYKGMDIGTAKVTREECQGIAHHLLDLRLPAESFSAAEYQKLARACIADIFHRGKTPILAGGTGLYIDSALYNYEYNKEEGEEAEANSLREALRVEAAKLGTIELWQKLYQVDPQSAKRLHPNDTKRIIRALEYEKLHGKPISENVQAYKAPRLIYPTIFFGLTMFRQELYQRINLRVDQMTAAGLAAEVLALQKEGLKLDSQAGQAIGYKQLLLFLEGTYTLEEAIEAIKQESRRYAKRQLTWFRRNPHIFWLDGKKMQEERSAEILAAFLQEREGVSESTEEGSGWGSDKIRDFLHQMGMAFLDHIGTAKNHLGNAKSGNTKTDAAADQSACPGD